MTDQNPAGHFMFLWSSSGLNRQIVSVSREKLHPLLPTENLKEDTTTIFFIINLVNLSEAPQVICHLTMMVFCA